MEAILTMTFGGAVAIVSVVAGTLTFFMYVAKEIFSYLKDKSTDKIKIEMVEIDKIKGELKELKSKIDELRGDMETSDSEIKLYIIESNNEKKSDIEKVGIRIEKLYDTILKWASEK